MGICSMAADPVVAEDRTTSTGNNSGVLSTTSASSHDDASAAVCGAQVATTTASCFVSADGAAVASAPVVKEGKPSGADAAPRMMMADLQSDTTVNSSSHSSSESDEDEVEEYGCDEYDEEGTDACDSSQRRFLLKPMPTLLQVCPVDDLAVEEEKRRRRHSQFNNSNNGSGKGKNVKRPCADAESLPTKPSPLLLRSSQQNGSAITTASPATTPRDSATAPSSGGAPFPAATPMLRRDSMAIRQQYWKQLGIPMTRSELERTSGRKKERAKGLKVRLNDAATKKGESKNFFQFIASWYGSNSQSVQSSEEPSSSASTASSSSRTERRASRSSRSGSAASQSNSGSVLPARRSIHFNEEAELFYIPLHKDYSKRQRDCMWHTRVEFISMVERNLEDVYEEMEREYEEQLEAEYHENEAMAREEARQRKAEAEQKAIEASNKAAADKAAAAKKQAAVAAATIRSRSPSLSPSTRGQPLSSGAAAAPIPTLSLCPNETQIKLAPRGRSTHDIRFKYLKHLGIQNT